MLKDKSYAGDIAIASAQSTRYEEYWMEKLSGELPGSVFTYDYHPDGTPPEMVPLTFAVPDDLFQRLLKLSGGSDYRLLMILVSGLTLLLEKYTCNKDIIIGSSIYRQKTEGDFVNTVWILRNRLSGGATFKDLLLQVRQTVTEAAENQNYPLETLLYQLDIPFQENDSHFPLFDVAILLENIQDKKYIRHIPINMIFSFLKQDSHMGGTAEYNKRLYKEESVRHFARHFIRLLQEVMANVNIPLSRVEILSPEEKNRLLYEFNDTRSEFPGAQTPVELFMERVAAAPDHLAVVFRDKQVTYRQLDKKAGGLAVLLRSGGIKAGGIVGLLLERSLEMVIAMMAVLKAGAAYLPIGIESPGARIRYIVEDIGLRVILTNLMDDDFSYLSGSGVETVHIGGTGIHGPLPGAQVPPGAGMNIPPAGPADPAYVIYTSGSTGKPRAVLVEVGNMANIIQWFGHRYDLRPSTRVLQMSDYTFDPSINQVFASLTRGAVVVVTDFETLGNKEKLRRYIENNQVHIINFVPSFLNELLGEGKKLPGLRAVISGAEKLDEAVKDRILGQGYRLYNQYGPTEATVDALMWECTGGKVTLGTPIANTCCYILGAENRLMPVGAPGELVIGGKGVARGYLNDPELTAGKFIFKPAVKQIQNKEPGAGLYRTGDLARWLPSGEVEFLGRIDYQMKINGYRVDPGEIERHLREIDGIEEALVIPHESPAGETYLCAYFSAKKETAGPEIKAILSRTLPYYMIPLYFIRLERFPLTPGMKIDRKSLPAPGTRSEGAYTAPRNKTEEKLLELWAGVLGKENASIGIDADFFESGGHSLTAVLLISRIHKTFEVKLPLVEIFTSPTIRLLSACIQGLVKEKHISIRPVEEKEYYALSPAQKQLYILQQLRPHEMAYNIPFTALVEGKIEKEQVNMVFDRIIRRHESFRTSFCLVDNEPVQVIHKENSAFEVTDTLENFVRPFDLGRAPLLRAGLVKKEDNKHLLMIDMHHIITDGASTGIFIAEAAALYNRGQLPPLRIRYKDYSEWRNHPRQKPMLAQQEKYWLNKLEPGLPALSLPIDYTRPKSRGPGGSSRQFTMDGKETAALKQLALQEGVTLNMVLLTAFNILLAGITGQEDITVGMPAVGRRHHDLDMVIGMFVNTLVLRNYPRGEKTCRTLLGEVKTTSLEALENQDYPFDHLVAKLVRGRDTGRNPLFDVMFVLQNTARPGIRLPDLEISPCREYENTTAKFDLAFYGREVRENLYFTVEYHTGLYKEETIEKFIAYYKTIISSFSSDPGREISRVGFVSPREKDDILYCFNNTAKKYTWPGNMNRTGITLHRLFENRVEITPDSTAVVFHCRELKGERQVTYRQLNREADGLAHFLREKGVARGTVVAVTAEFSIKMLTAIWAILKAGGIYLPVSAAYPLKRICCMLDDSKAKLLLVTGSPGRDMPVTPEVINLETGQWKDRRGENPGHAGIDNDPAYLLYTSGTSGTPKAVMVQHSSVINTLRTLQEEYPLNETGAYLLKTSLVFDVSLTEIFGWFWGGGRIVIPGPGGDKDPLEILETICRGRISHINFVPSLFAVFIDVLNNKNKDKLSRLKYIFLAGEALAPGLVHGFARLNPGRTILLENLYGPTEAAIYTTKYSLRGWDGKTAIPIGKPLTNVNTYILDKYHRLLPAGIAGELCISGPVVAGGYLNNPELTAERFLVFYRSYRTNRTYISSKKLYKTGDLARWLADGNIEFFGRIDQQVKIRGNRVELGEIENRLLRHKHIKETVVLARKNNNDENILCAYFTTDKSPGVPELREYLAQTLPGYMIPSYFVPLEKIPLLPSSKIDRDALPEPGIILNKSIELPRDPGQQLIAQTWKDVLGLAEVGIHDNFFDLGGTSLDVIRVNSRLKDLLNKDIPLLAMFEYTTIDALARFINRETGKGVTRDGPGENLHTEIQDKARTRMAKFKRKRINN